MTCARGGHPLLMTRTQIDPTPRLRPETDADVEFLADLYASTREEELRPVEWSDELKKTFLRSQFDAQSLHYKEHYSAAEYWVIEREGEPIGPLSLTTRPKDLRIADIPLTPEPRAPGVGGASSASFSPTP